MLLKGFGEHLSSHSTTASANIFDRGLHPSQYDLWMISSAYGRLQSIAADSAGLQWHLVEARCPTLTMHMCKANPRPYASMAHSWELPKHRTWWEGLGGKWTSYSCPTCSWFSMTAPFWAALYKLKLGQNSSWTEWIIAQVVQGVGSVYWLLCST